MAAIKIDQVQLAIVGMIEGQFQNWQALVRDGRRIESLNIQMTNDASNQREYEIIIGYSAAPTPGPASNGAIT